jgi:hypothetical protein
VWKAVGSLTTRRLLGGALRPASRSSSLFRFRLFVTPNPTSASLMCGITDSLCAEQNYWTDDLIFTLIIRMLTRIGKVHLAGILRA